jgi:hypothetical protein
MRHARCMIESCNHRTRKRVIDHTSVRSCASVSDGHRRCSDSHVVRGWTRLRAPTLYVPRGFHGNGHCIWWLDRGVVGVDRHSHAMYPDSS